MHFLLLHKLQFTASLHQLSHIANILVEIFTFLCTCQTLLSQQLTVYSDQFLWSLEMEPMTLALLTPSSTNWSKAHDFKCLFYSFWSMSKHAVFFFYIYCRAQQCLCKCQFINCRDIDQSAPHRLTIYKVYSRLNNSRVESEFVQMLPVFDSKCKSRMNHTLRWQSDGWN